ncbi:MAG TPA: 30S ribosomal protein S20 [Anaerohalosphaeraceae bacterium]|nr:30S ribosomal protein S20 [Phycisphaerae bacterium]HOK95213.1 30S ribosomal protein S20 [Anaerohalosphaeraceae bacterium]HOL32654.1 30S ribosomal protein S20 [Anaerohalosphaeraceae bacterium]HOM75705.1 30S ribosomal protein S20 [Anaerohalosphaeraceae bacterium]HPC64808.1 30S ribosomal protein S20 [Anaerohalosphaeraceae bacterium]
MAHSLSAKKRVRQNAKRRAINRARKSMIKTQIKHLESALNAGDAEKAKEQFRSLARRLDKVASTSTMHKNTAARIKSRMARKVNKLAAKTAG